MRKNILFLALTLCIASCNNDKDDYEFKQVFTVSRYLCSDPKIHYNFTITVYKSSPEEIPPRLAENWFSPSNCVTSEPFKNYNADIINRAIDEWAGEDFCKSVSVTIEKRIMQ